PVNYTYSDGQYWDETIYNIPVDAASLEVKLLYQTASKEYIDFLRTGNITNNSGQILYDLWSANGKSAPEIMVQKTIDISTNGMKDNYSRNISVYPNPADEWITFRFAEPVNDDDLTVSLIDARGSYVMRSQKLIVSGDEAKLNIGKLGPGKYVFVIENRNTVQVSRGKIVVR
ncbi:MAG: T9SS type A sorting domain-containing protein, partial [Bacteroidales bacterium]|nr:T9SS type A sorting domain-containing protein [Bacteroidales bacterium]